MNASDINGGFPHLEEYDPEPAGSNAVGRRSGLVLALALAMLALGGGTLWFLDATSQLSADKPQACATIDDADLRLSCYDSSVHRALPQPARGANARVN